MQINLSKISASLKKIVIHKVIEPKSFIIAFPIKTARKIIGKRSEQPKEWITATIKAKDSVWAPKASVLKRDIDDKVFTEDKLIE